jgi:hypothetical protein
MELRTGLQYDARHELIFDFLNRELVYPDRDMQLLQGRHGGNSDRKANRRRSQQVVVGRVCMSRRRSRRQELSPRPIPATGLPV